VVHFTGGIKFGIIGGVKEAISSSSGNEMWEEDTRKNAPS
jgi:hypothetical protein